MVSGSDSEREKWRITVSSLTSFLSAFKAKINQHFFSTLTFLNNIAVRRVSKMTTRNSSLVGTKENERTGFNTTEDYNWRCIYTFEEVFGTEMRELCTSDNPWCILTHLTPAISNWHFHFNYGVDCFQCGPYVGICRLIIFSYCSVIARHIVWRLLDPRIEHSVIITLKSWANICHFIRLSSPKISDNLMIAFLDDIFFLSFW